MKFASQNIAQFLQKIQAVATDNTVLKFNILQTLYETDPHNPELKLIYQEVARQSNWGLLEKCVTRHFKENSILRAALLKHRLLS